MSELVSGFCGMRNRFKVQNTINTGQLRPEFNSTALFFLFFHFLEILSIISLNYKKYFFIIFYRINDVRTEKKKKIDILFIFGEGQN